MDMDELGNPYPSLAIIDDGRCSAPLEDRQSGRPQPRATVKVAGACFCSRRERASQMELGPEDPLELVGCGRYNSSHLNST